MRSPSRRFLAFHAAFWLIAGIGLFVSGVTQMPLSAALVRNLFLPVAGFLTAFSLLPLIEVGQRRGALAQRAIAFSAAYGVALFCVVVINAITFTQHGVELAAIGFGQWVSGAMNFFLVLAIWTELVIQQVYVRRDAETGSQPGDLAAGSLPVTDRGTIRPVPFAQITHVTAARDYVEVHLLGERRPLVERRTLSSLVERLPAATFLQVHRGAIVNCDRVVAFEPLSKGRGRLTLEGGATVESSRGYRDAIHARFTQAAPQLG